MSSTSSVSGKSLSAPPATNYSQPPQQGAAPVSFDSSRRQSQNQNSGPSIPQAGAPRKGQAARKQHRNQKRAGALRDPTGRAAFEEDDDAMAEMRAVRDAVRNPTSRRGQTSITHLLNYALPSRPYYDSHHAPSSRSYRRNPTWGMGSGHHAMDKARYVHANYRFVVSPTGNYTSQAMDADEHLEWSDVLQVVASAESQQTSCPICLSEPVAPRMAKCGHIFCLPCLIRFMNSSSSPDDSHGHHAPEKKQKEQTRWRKCPICEDYVYIADVRPVRFYAGQESRLPRPGDDVVLRLMMRNAKSTLALPREGGAEVLEANEDVPWHFAAGVLDYARIMKGTGDYMAEQFDREIEELLRQEKEDELMFHEDNEWTQKAIRAVSAAKEKMQGLGDAELAVSSAIAAAGGSRQARHAEQDFYFYTSPPHLYLSPLDIRILKTRYGSFSAFPSTLLPIVEHISTGNVVDDALRKRAKYLGHLPYGCLISFLECDWTDIVPEETLAQFAVEIERRRKRIKDKAAQEERERLQAERIEAAAIRGSGARRAHGLPDEEVTVRYGNATEADYAPVDLVNDFLPLGGEGNTPPNNGSRYLYGSDASTSPNGNARRTVWGTPAIPVSPTLGAQQQQQRTVDDGWLKDDDVLETLGAAEIALQMEAFGIEPEAKQKQKQKYVVLGGGAYGETEAEGSGSGAGGAATNVGGGGAGGGGKKKKKQKITLMSTGGRRAIN
ncbi:hypothetical protein B0T17DRAFT_540928 [Bombardia bombarda]|uniref:RING-type domain-containing protein n=1 Tax=Bombardia bombarda TaxID=252184 RepID=A0AA39WGN4_9PEZI|nr:hypothetical protein B0T17DRAFT_540928 [Bombardia bombarda]